MVPITPSMLRRLCLALLCSSVVPSLACAADRGGLERGARTALKKLTSRVPAAPLLSRSAVAVLVLPKITKAGVDFGERFGDGVLIVDGTVAGYHNTSGASCEAQAGAQQFGPAMRL